MIKFNLPAADLKTALTGLGKVVGKRTTLPVLGCVRIERDKAGVTTISATDLDAFVSVRVSKDHDRPGAILVPFAEFNTVVKRCSDGDNIQIQHVGKEDALLTYPVGHGQRAEQHVQSLPEKEWPPFPKVTGEPMALPETFCRSLLEAFQCASNDDTRIILQSAFVDVSDRKGHHIVATDGRHLYASNSFRLPLTSSVIIPDHRFLAWKGLAGDGEWKLRVHAAGKKECGLVQIVSDHWTCTTKQVEGIYPNWRQAIPSLDQYQTTIEFEAAAVKDLKQTIDRLPCSDKVNHRVGIKTDGKKVSLVGHSDGKPVEVRVNEALAKGREVTVYLNREFVLQALGFGLCTLQITDALSPVRFSDNDGRQLIVMPIRPDSMPAHSTPVPASKSPSPPPPPSLPAASTSSTNKHERNKTMRNGNSNGNGHVAVTPRGNGADKSSSALELAIGQIEVVKATIRTAVGSLNNVSETLKQAQRERRGTDREIKSVRSTLQTLQRVRL